MIVGILIVILFFFSFLQDYLRINKEITKFFVDQGITQVTIQPEFTRQKPKNAADFEISYQTNSTPCLMQCMTDVCRKRNCCVEEKDAEREEGLEAIKVESSTNASKANDQSSPCENVPSSNEPEQKASEKSRQKSNSVNQTQQNRW